MKESVFFFSGKLQMSRVPNAHYFKKSINTHKKTIATYLDNANNILTKTNRQLDSTIITIRTILPYKNSPYIAKDDGLNTYGPTIDKKSIRRAVKTVRFDTECRVATFGGDIAARRKHRSELRAAHRTS